MMWVGSRVYMIVKFNDMNILSLIVMINLTLISKILFYSTNAYYEQKE